MRPKLFIYKGIELKFFSDEYKPIQVHAMYGEMQMKVEFYIENKEIKSIKYKTVRGYSKFSPTKLKHLKELINDKKYDVINKWIRIFVYNERNVKPLKINKL